MSQTRAQLVSPVGVVTASGINVSGVVTATSFSGDGSGLTNLSVSYVPTAGIATLSQGLSGTPNIVVGIATANTELDVGVGGTVITALSSTGGVGFGTANPVSKIDLFGSTTQSIVAIAASDINCSLGNYYIDTVNGNKTYTVSGVVTDRVYSFSLEVTHTTGTITWFSGVEWPGGTPPTLTTGKNHLFIFITDDGGSRWRAASLVDYTN